MENCTFELIVNILTYAIKNKNESFSQKDFKNIVYTNEFNNFDMNEKIANGFDFLLKRGLIQLKTSNATYYEKYVLSNILKINTENYTKVYKELAKRIILEYEGKENILNYDFNEYNNLIENLNLIKSNFLSYNDKEELKIIFSKILISLNTPSNYNYSLLTIMQLIKLDTFINIEIKNKNNSFIAKNIKLDYIQFNDESLVIYFNKCCCIELDNLSSIIKIEITNNILLEKQIKNILNILENYSHLNTKIIIDFLKNMINEK